MSGIICCACSPSAISVLQLALLQWQKRAQQESGEERVTAKSRPMMNLTAKMPSVVSSLTSVSLVRRHYGSQDPWRSTGGEDRLGRLDKGTDLFEASDHHYHEQFMESFSSTSYSKFDDNRAWSSQERRFSRRSMASTIRHWKR